MTTEPPTLPDRLAALQAHVAPGQTEAAILEALRQLRADADAAATDPRQAQTEPAWWAAATADALALARMYRGDASGAATDYRDAAARWEALGHVARRDASIAAATTQAVAAGEPLDAIITEVAGNLDRTAGDPPGLARTSLLVDLARLTANVGDRFDAGRRADEAAALLTELGYGDPSEDAEAAYRAWTAHARESHPETTDWLRAMSAVLSGWAGVLGVRGAIGRGWAETALAAMPALSAGLSAEAGVASDAASGQLTALADQLRELYTEYEAGAAQPDPGQLERMLTATRGLISAATTAGQPQLVGLARVLEADLLIWGGRLDEAIAGAAAARSELAGAALGATTRTDLDIELIRRQVQVASEQEDSVAVSHFAGEGIAVIEDDRARLELPYLADDYLRTRRILYVAGIAAARRLGDLELMLERADLVKARGARAWLPGPPAEVSAIRASLAADEVVLYHLWADRTVLYVFTVTREDITCDRRLLSEAERTAIDEVVHDFYDPQQRPPFWADDDLPALGELLLPTDGGDLLAAARRVYLSPNGIAHQLPLHALTWRGGPLIATHEVSYVPNFAALTPRPIEVGAGRPLVVGVSAFAGAPTLAHTEDEARALAIRLPAADLLVGAAANLAAIEARRTDGRLAAAPLLHLATHGEDGPLDDPLAARFLLADGAVTGTAMRDWSLAADLVVLSACWSAQRAVVGRDGAELFGDEVYGLQSAFFAAGARQVLGAMWPASDRVAAPLMQRFYERLLAGDSTAAALRDATNAARGVPGSLLYEWAPFKLTTMGRPAAEGDPR